MRVNIHVVVVFVVLCVCLLMAQAVSKGAYRICSDTDSEIRSRIHVESARLLSGPNLIKTALTRDFTLDWAAELFDKNIAAIPYVSGPSANCSRATVHEFHKSPRLIRSTSRLVANASALGARRSSKTRMGTDIHRESAVNLVYAVIRVFLETRFISTKIVHYNLLL